MNNTTAYLVDLLAETPQIWSDYCSKDGFLHWVSTVSDDPLFDERIQSLAETYDYDLARTRRLKENPEYPSIELSYDAQMSEVKDVIKRLINTISRSGDYAQLDCDLAQQLVTRNINKAIGIKTLERQTYAVLVKWVNSAKATLNGMNTDYSDDYLSVCK